MKNHPMRWIIAGFAVAAVVGVAAGLIRRNACYDASSDDAAPAGATSEPPLKAAA
jgi:hypothetical protein